MKFLVVLVNILLVVAIVIASLLLIADKTASAKYLESVAQKTNAYQALSQLLPTQIAQQSNSDDAQQQQQLLGAMQAALTPDYIQNQIASALTQLELAVKSNGQEVTINLDHISATARDRGLKISSDKLKPIVISPDKLQKPIKIVGIVEMAKLIALCSALALFLLSLFLCYWRRSYIGLGVALVVTGSLEAILLIALFVVPGPILAQINLGGSIVSFSPLITSIINHIFVDLRIDVGSLAALLLLVGVLLLIFGKHLPGRKLLKGPTTPSSPKKPDEQKPKNKSAIDSIKPPQKTS